MSEYRYVTYEELDGGSIARIMLNRPESRNAQHRGLLVELDEAFGRAERDDRVRVVVLGGVGPIFSSGHDLNQTVDTMGFHNALQSCFTLHQLNHSHWAQLHDNKYPVALPEDGIADWRSAPPVRVATRDTVGGPADAPAAG